MTLTRSPKLTNLRVAGAGMTEPQSAGVHDPLDEDDDIYDALAINETWFVQDEDGTLLPISREQIAQALAWRRRLAERD